VQAEETTKVVLVNFTIKALRTLNLKGSLTVRFANLHTSDLSV